MNVRQLADLLTVHDICSISFSIFWKPFVNDNDFSCLKAWVTVWRKKLQPTLHIAPQFDKLVSNHACHFVLFYLGGILRYLKVEWSFLSLFYINVLNIMEVTVWYFMLSSRWGGWCVGLVTRWPANNCQNSKPTRHLWKW